MMNKGTAIVSILIAFVGGVLIGNLTAKPSGGGDGRVRGNDLFL